MTSQPTRFQLRPNPRQYFLDNIKSIYQSWTTLVSSTTLPLNIKHDDERITHVLQMLNNFIENEDNKHFMQRLAYVELDKVMDTIIGIVGQDRRTCYMHGKAGQTDSSVAFDILVRATRRSKESLHRQRKISKRWAVLAGSCPLLVVLFSIDTERFMLVFPSLTRSHV